MIQIIISKKIKTKKSCFCNYKVGDIFTLKKQLNKKNCFLLKYQRFFNNNFPITFFLLTIFNRNLPLFSRLRQPHFRTIRISLKNVIFFIGSINRILAFILIFFQRCHNRQFFERVSFDKELIIFAMVTFAEFRAWDSRMITFTVFFQTIGLSTSASSSIDFFIG